jgi:uncharacterized protein (TIGR02996 family)
VTGDHDALLRAICENPREDTPRLVYADWLEENGQPERAAFIRTDVAMALHEKWDAGRLRCEEGLTRKKLLAQPWAGGLFPPLPKDFEWDGEPVTRRGFPWSVYAHRPDQALARHPDVLTRFPVERVSCFASPAAPANLRKLAGLGGADRLTGLRFSGGAHSAKSLGPLLSGAFLGLEELTFGLNAITAAGARALFESPVPDRLTALNFAGPEGWGVGRVVLEALAADRGPRLRCLHLRYTLYGDENHQQLIECRLPPDLRVLDLASIRLNGERAVRLAGVAALGQLRALGLSRNPVGNAGAAALFTSPHLAGLKVLDLSYCQVGDDALRALLENSPLADGLNRLDLTGSPASGDMKQAVQDRMGDRVRL